jgi:hypothetical protein
MRYEPHVVAKDHDLAAGGNGIKQNGEIAFSL